MTKLFHPAVRLLNRLNYPQKFTLISLLFVLPLALVMTLLLGEISTQLRFTQKERSGLAYLVPLRRLMEDVATVQLMTIEAAQGDTSVRVVLPRAHARIDEDFAALVSMEQRVGAELGTAEQLGTLAAVWEQLRGEQAQLSLVSSAPRYDQFMAELEALQRHIGNSSNLILDHDLDTYYLMDTALRTLPDGQRLLAQMTLESEQLGNTTGSAYQRAHMFELLTLYGANADATTQGLRAAFTSNQAQQLDDTLSPLLQRSSAASTAYLEAARRIVDERAASVADRRAKGEIALDVSYLLWDQVSLELDTLLQQRIDGLLVQLYGTIGLAVVALSLVLYLLIGFYRSMMQTVAALDHAAQRLVRGDATGGVDLRTRDELGQVAASFNRIATALLEAGAQRRAVVEHAADGILTLDAQGRIGAFNRAAEQMFGYSAAEAAALGITQLMPAYGAVTQATGTQAELAGRRKDGTAFPADVTLSRTEIGQQWHSVLIVRDATERKQAEAERERLQQQIIDAQAAAIEQLATPLIPVTDRTLVMPLIGAIDSGRADQIVATLLQGIEAHGAAAAILDITGVPVVDTHVARTLLNAAQAASLLGARAIITGVRPEVAVTLVTIGATLEGLTTCASLQAGIALATAHEARVRRQLVA